jgi:hypothetical protein
MVHHGKQRKNKRCENCGHFVEKRFCPECGQENVETRQRFHYLFMHFIEDFVHYDSRFWKTILFLLFRPAKLTIEYLAGKRKLYVPPVTLYIFISFITFFVPAILPDLNKKMEEPSIQEITAEEQTENNDNSDNKEKEKEKNSTVEKEKPSKNFTFILRDEKIEDDKIDKIANHFDVNKWKEKIIHDAPKAIFLYMPIFAFWLWLFHSKKKWYYFDHGIYTLHYFSFILLSILLYTLMQWLLLFFHIKMDLIDSLVTLTMFGYFIYYYFHSHRLVYRETKAISRLKCSFLFIINTICIFLFLLLFLIIEAFITDDYLFKEIMSFINKN